MDASHSPAPVTEADQPPARAAGSATDEEKKRQREKENQELLEEIWPRETKDLIQYRVKTPAGLIELPITQDLMGRRFEYAIGNIIWDAAVGMHHYFQLEEHFPVGFFRGKRVLELGSGTGLVGLTLTALGAEVYMTDLPNVLDLLHHNIKACFPPSVVQEHGLTMPVVEALSWGEPVPEERRRAYDMVVGSDITYDTEKCVLLRRTLLELCREGEGVALYLGHLERGDEAQFFERLKEDFEVSEVYTEDTKEESVARAHWVHVFLAHRKRIEGGGGGEGGESQVAR